MSGGATLGDAYNYTGGLLGGKGNLFGQAASGGSGGSGARSIDQLYSFLKNKSDQATMKMYSTAENESKAFFASKNVDIGSLEYSLKTVQASIAQLSTRQQLQKPSPTLGGTQFGQSNLLSTYVASTAKGDDYLSSNLSVQEYRDKLSTYVSQKAAKTCGLAKSSLASAFTGKASNAFKKAQASLTLIGSEDSSDSQPQLKMRTFKEFGEPINAARGEVRSGEQTGRKDQQVAALQNVAIVE